MSNATCVTDGCTNVRGHGRYCHPCRNLNRHPERRKVTLICQRCGSEFDRTGTTGPKPRFCSDRCRVGTPDSVQCAGCGTDFRPKNGRQKYCVPSCKYLFHARGATRKSTSRCVGCGAVIDLTERMGDGRIRRPSYTKRCDSCQAKARPHRYSMTAEQVALRDGCECRWCHKPIDMALVGSRSKWAPSVDHIIPWSLGGSNEPNNLQLMHRVCNAQKGTRVPA